MVLILGLILDKLVDLKKKYNEHKFGFNKKKDKTNYDNHLSCENHLFNEHLFCYIINNRKVKHWTF